MQQYHQTFAKSAFDYTTVKRLQAYYGQDRARLADHLATLGSIVEQKGLPTPHFAMVDEMLELNQEQLNQFSADVAAFKTAIPEAMVAGQLNKPKNRQLLGLMDTVLINHGFGVDKQTIRTLQGQGKQVWLYNLTNARLAAGFYLWRSGAQGYLQWHGRMPTGAPYYPMDGREADFQFFYPAIKACPSVPDINATLLALSEGIADRRWLNWLMRQARREEQGTDLAE